VILVDALRGALIADFGRSSHVDFKIDHDEFTCAGDLSYAPPELLHEDPPRGWDARRRGCDCYLLGSLIYSMFQQSSLTSFIIGRLPNNANPMIRDRKIPDYRASLPHWQNGFSEALHLLSEGLRNSPIQSEVVEWVAQLSNPDFDLRCSPRSNGHVDKYDLSRLISRLDRAKHTVITIANRN